MDALLPETLALRARYDEEPSHSDHVAALALQLFDALRPWHGLDERARELLHSGALLHDIGWSQTPDGRGHHKWSARLIREYGWKHLAAGEVKLVAQIARYHRKAPPQAGHEEFHALKAGHRKLVMILGGILRLGDALDRTHSARIRSVKAAVSRESLTVRVRATGDWKEERDMFAAKADMLAAAAGRDVRVVAAT